MKLFNFRETKTQVAIVLLVFFFFTLKTARAAFFTALATGLGIITGVAQVGSWITGGLSGDDKVEIDWKLPAAQDAEIGLTLIVPWEVEFKFVDTFLGSADYAFMEVYVSLGTELMFLERYPSTGYIENPDTWFDDSQTKKLSGKLYIGVKKLDADCRNITDALMIDGRLWKDVHQVYPNTTSGFYIGGGSYKGFWTVGEGLITTGRLQLVSELAMGQVTSQVTVMNPYFNETLQTDNGATKNHHQSGFGHNFKARMNYALNYVGLQVRDPDEDGQVTINGLPSSADWTWTTPGNLSPIFNIGKGKSHEQLVDYTGRHGVITEHHPNLTSTYADDWGATITGTNVVFFDSNPQVEQEYSWTAKFRKAPNNHSECTPIDFSVTDEDPHECDPGTPLVCDDSNVCNGTETCDPATLECVPGTPLVCDDNDVCNGTESCDPITGCAPGTPLFCDDGNVCNGTETCDPAMGCVAGTPLNCDPLCICVPATGCDCSLAVTLSAFDAEEREGQVIVTWSTEAEIDNEGFNVLRSPDPTHLGKAINSSLIPAEGGPAFGASYTFVDDSVRSGVTYYYLLQDISTLGESTLHGADACTLDVDSKCEPIQVRIPRSTDKPKKSLHD